MPQAGYNVRVLARRRRLKAVLLFLLASFWAFLPFVLPHAVKTLLPMVPMVLPGWAYLGCFVPASLSLLRAKHWWMRANHADQGAAGEEAIAAVLAPLKAQGWQVEYGIRDRSVGDVDVFLVSPQGQAYTIDVKSHRGEVRSDGQQLYRQYGRSQYPFEKDFLKQAKGQAIAMKRAKKLSYVTPIVAFSQARVEITENPIAGVYVVAKPKLLGCLRSLG